MAVIFARIVLSVCAVAFIPALQAQTYPAKPVRLVVPFAPGGSTDVIARVVTQKMAEGFGQQIVIDNRPGAASSLGTEAAARAAPDGYMLLMGDRFRHAAYRQSRMHAEFVVSGRTSA